MSGAARLLSAVRMASFTRLGSHSPAHLDSRQAARTAKPTDTSSHLPRATASYCLAVALVVFGPLAFASLLLAALCHGALWDCPPIWHDEVWYYNEIATFHEAGWDGGYTISHEWPAQVAGSHFGPHGPFFPALYGTLTRLTGLTAWSIPLLNAVLLLLSSLLWFACCRPSLRGAWTSAFIALTFWPLVLYVPTSMQEGLHMAIGFTLAALVTMLLRKPANRWLLVATLGCVIMAAQIRVTWALVAVPVLWVAWQPARTRQWIALAAVAALVVGPLFLEATALNSPYPNFMSEVSARLHDSVFGAVGLVIVHTLKGIVRYLGPTKDTFLQIGMRYQTLMIAGAAFYHLRRSQRSAVAATAPSDPDPDVMVPSLASAQQGNHYRIDALVPPSVHANEQTPSAQAAFGFTLLNLACVVGLVIVLYDVFDWRDYRVIAPHLLLSLLVLAGCGARDWLTGYAIVAALLGALAIPQFAKFHRPRVAVDQQQIAAFAEQVGQAIPFEPDASAWDNTLLIDIDPLQSPLLCGLPSGIGVSVVNYWDRQAWPPRSKYVLLNDELAARLGIPAGMRPLVRTALGTIYVQQR